MALYLYQAFSKDGKKVSGSVDASSLPGAREQLVRMGLYPTKITLAVEGGMRPGFSLKSLLVRKVSLKDKIFFTKQLSMLLKSGVPLLNALELLIEQTEGNLRKIVIELKDGIKEGRSLADGLSKYPKVFDTIYVQLIKAGEATGRLEFILDRLTAYLTKRELLRKKISGALTYPIIQLVVIGIVTVILLTLVVPEIAQTFEAEGGQLPLNTRILIGVSDFLINHYIILLVALVTLYGSYRLWKATPGGARAIDAIKLKLPFINYFVRTNVIVQFSSTLGMLMEAGVNLAEALDIVVKIVQNRILVDTLNQARENIIKQGKVAEYLKQTGIFPPIAIYLINTGEQSGNLDTMLTTVADYYEAQLTDITDRLTTLLQPIMMLIMAVIVGFIVLSIVGPLLSLQKLAAQ